MFWELKLLSPYYLAGSRQRAAGRMPTTGWQLAASSKLNPNPKISTAKAPSAPRLK